LRDRGRERKSDRYKKIGIRGSGCSSMTKTFKREEERRMEEEPLISSLVNYHLLKCNGIST
jgi:hypothetical protein